MSILYSKMNTTVYVQLILLCLFNIILSLSALILNSLVIITFWKATQLRKNLCHFMIMVLSCCDLITLLTGTQGFFLRFKFCLTENYNLLTTIEVYHRFENLSAGISMLALLLLSIERYLGVYYPIFHRTAVTKRRLLASLAIFTILPATFVIISTNEMVISYPVALAIFLSIYVAPFIFFNYGLFKIARKTRRRNGVPPETRMKMKSLKNVSSCLLAVACLVLLSIPIFVHIVVSLIEGSLSSNARLSFMWVTTVFLMNCIFNSLIFFWKNKILRIEGIKVLQAMKARVFGTDIPILD